MSILNTRDVFACNGADFEFTLTFAFEKSADVLVLLSEDAADNEKPLIRNLDYTIEGTTLRTRVDDFRAPYPAGWTLVAMRRSDFEQPSSQQMTPDVFRARAAHLTRMFQEINEQVARTLISGTHYPALNLTSELYILSSSDVLLSGTAPSVTAPDAYSFTPTRTGGTGPYVFTIIAGSLPPGLSLNSSSGEVSGVPSLYGTYSYTMRVVDAIGGISVCSFTTHVFQLSTTLHDNSAVDETSETYTFAQLGLTGVTWSIVSGAIPSGWSFNTSTADLGGVATSGGAFTITLRATGLNGSGLPDYAQRVYNFRVGTIIALLHLNGAPNGTSFPDEVGNVWTRGGTSLITSTVQSKFGGSALHGQLNTPLSRLVFPTNNLFSFPGTPFTVDTWVYFNNVGGSWIEVLCERASSAAGRLEIFYDKGSNNIFVQFANTSTTAFGVIATPASYGQWYHIAVTSEGVGGLFRFFLNGVLAGSMVVTGAPSTDLPSKIFGDVSTNQNFTGYANEFRVTSGVARWIANFTPPAAPSDYA